MFLPQKSGKFPRWQAYQTVLIQSLHIIHMYWKAALLSTKNNYVSTKKKIKGVGVAQLAKHSPYKQEDLSFILQIYVNVYDLWAREAKTEFLGIPGWLV